MSPSDDCLGCGLEEECEMGSPFYSWKVERQFEVIIVSSGFFFLNMYYQFGQCWRCPKGPSIHLIANIGQIYCKDGVVGC